MNYWREIRQFGAIRTVPTQEKKPRGNSKKHDDSIEICLNCKKKVCRGCSSKFEKK